MSLKTRFFEFAGLKPPEKQVISTARVAPNVTDRWLIPAGTTYKPEDIHRWIQSAQGGDTTFLHAFEDDMRSRDAHLQTEMSKAEMNVIGRRTDILPYPSKYRTRVKMNVQAGDGMIARDVASYCEEMILAPEVGFDDAAISLMNGCWKGLGAIQVVTELYGKGEGMGERIAILEPVPSQRFYYEQDSTELMVMLDGTRGSAVTVASLGASLVVYQPDAGIPDPSRRGLFRALFPFFAIRTFGPGWWARFVEIFGMPLRKGVYPKDNLKVKADLMEALRTAGNAPWIAIPEGADVSFESRSPASGGDIHQPLMEWSSREISKLVIGSTQTTDIQKGTGSRASANVHQVTADDLADHRGRRLARCLRQQFLFPFVVRKFGIDVAIRFTPELVFRRKSEYANLLELSESMKNFKEAGAGEAVPISAVNELGGIPVPEEGEPTLGPPSTPPLPFGNKPKEPDPAKEQQSSPQNEPDVAPNVLTSEITKPAKSGSTKSTSPLTP